MNRSTVRTCLVLAVAAGALAPAAPLRATGDYHEEPLTTLPDFLKLDLLPAKSFSKIVEETGPFSKTRFAWGVFLEHEVAAFKTMTGAQVLAQIDRLLARARAEESFDTLKVLNDLRDLYAGPANPTETAQYIAWRLGAPTLDRKAIDTQLQKAPPALRPHYLYLRGAAEFLDHNDVECQEWFAKILKEYPKHPRAEIALYMMARSQLSRSRTADYGQGEAGLDAKQRPRAKQLLDEYLAKYPRGRYAGDALGWLGAWHYDAADYAAALHCYLGQLAMPDHPEFTTSATAMCEKTLSRLASAPNDKAWDDVARNPVAAQALVYLLINSTESDNYNHKFDPPDEVKEWRRKLLPKIARAIAAQEKRYQDATWHPRYLATLALASSGMGQQDEALKLLDTASPDAATDDLLLARGVVLQRAHRDAEAIPVLRALLKDFPMSPLARGARLRLGLALADAHQVGQAILDLDPLLVPRTGYDAPPTTREVLDETGAYPIYSDVEEYQVRQLIDFWLNFAPLEELTGAALTPDLDPLRRLRLTEPIAQRLLAGEKFEEARKFMTPAQYGLVAAPLEKLTIDARAAKEPVARAAACLALGDAWAVARGKLLTYPLDTDKNRTDVYLPREKDLANTRRAEAAAISRYPGDFRLDLENRDELRHAFQWWIEAADAQPGTATAARALWQALRAMPLIADVSTFTAERAVARKWGDESRKLYDRLRKENADSVEAKRYAVYWSFPPPPQPPPDQQYPYLQTREPVGSRMEVAQLFGAKSDDSRYPTEKEVDSILQELRADAGRQKPEVLKARLENLRDQARKEYKDLYGASWVNFYDDLALFFSEPDPGAEVRERYTNLRIQFLRGGTVGGVGFGWGNDTPPDFDARLQKDIAKALSDPRSKPVADYFEFLDLAVIANHYVFRDVNNVPKSHEADVLQKGDGDTYRTRDYPLLARKTRAFLDKYPQSKKREAAMLLEARAVYRSSAEVTLRNLFPWPQGARWEGGYLSTVTSQEPFDPNRVLQVLDAYDRDFSTGRYAGDIRDYRAGVALRQRDWKTALDLTAAQLADPKREDLQAAAAVRLGELFPRLADERDRADLLPAIKASARGRELLLTYLRDTSDYHPLRYLDAWLREQLGSPSDPPTRPK